MEERKIEGVCEEDVPPLRRCHRSSGSLLIVEVSCARGRAALSAQHQYHPGERRVAGFRERKNSKSS